MRIEIVVSFYLEDESKLEARGRVLGLQDVPPQPVTWQK